MTVLIVGGIYQNKCGVADRCYAGLPRESELQLRVREALDAGRDPMELLDGLRGMVILCDELGCGVVPMDKNDERWREATGRLCCAIAEEADAVIRVVAGLPQVIKGELP